MASNLHMTKQQYLVYVHYSNFQNDFTLLIYYSQLTVKETWRR